jgi:hypothetical protein
MIETCLGNWLIVNGDVFAYSFGGSDKRAEERAWTASGSVRPTSRLVVPHGYLRVPACGPRTAATYLRIPADRSRPSAAYLHIPADRPRPFAAYLRISGDRPWLRNHVFPSLGRGRFGRLAAQDSYRQLRALGGRCLVEIPSCRRNSRPPHFDDWFWKINSACSSESGRVIGLARGGASRTPRRTTVGPLRGSSSRGGACALPARRSAAGARACRIRSRPSLTGVRVVHGFKGGPRPLS